MRIPKRKRGERQRKVEKTFEKTMAENSKKLAKEIAKKGFSSSSDSKASACNAGDPGSIPRSGRSSGEGNDNPLQYSCLENFMGRNFM